MRARAAHFQGILLPPSPSAEPHPGPDLRLPILRFFRRLRTYLLWLFLLVLGGWGFPLEAASIWILSDEPSLHKAKQVQLLLRNEKPWSLMSPLEVLVKSVESSDILCPSEESMFACELSPAAERRLWAQAGVELPLKVLLVKHNPNWLGAAWVRGFYGTMTSAAEAWVGVHELLHLLGWGDEYALLPDMAVERCRGVISNPNRFGRKTLHDSIDEPLAWNYYWRFLPWRFAIPRGTLLTQMGRLGSPESVKVGLHPLPVCSLAPGGFQVWAPVKAFTVMGGATTHIPEFYWPRIAAALGVTK